MTTHGAPPNAVQNTKNTDVSYGAQQPAPKSFIPGVVHDDKYRAVPRPKTPIKDNEIRVASDGLVPRYVTYAARLFMEQEMKSITIKATGNAIPLAISVAEIVKRRFSNLHQLNVIGTTTISDVFEPVNGGLEGGVVHERDVPFIELTLTTNTELLDTAAAGYQKPIDQSLVKQMVAEDIIASRSRRGGRGGFRGGPGRRPTNLRRGRGGYRRGFNETPAGDSSAFADTAPNRRRRFTRGGRGYRHGPDNNRGGLQSASEHSPTEQR